MPHLWDNLSHTQLRRKKLKRGTINKRTKGQGMHMVAKARKAIYFLIYHASLYQRKKCVSLFSSPGLPAFFLHPFEADQSICQYSGDILKIPLEFDLNNLLVQDVWISYFFLSRKRSLLIPSLCIFVEGMHFLLWLSLIRWGKYRWSYSLNVKIG